MKLIKTTLVLTLFFLCQCTVAVNFEENFSGTWDILLIDILDEFDLPWTQGVGTEAGDDCCGPGDASIMYDGYTVYYETTSRVDGNGNYTVTLMSDSGDTGTVSGQFNRDNTGNGTYSIGWSNNSGVSMILTGNWEGTRR